MEKQESNGKEENQKDLSENVVELSAKVNACIEFFEITLRKLKEAWRDLSELSE